MTSKTTNRFAPQVRERPVRDVFDHEQDRPSRWTTVVSIAETIGCVPQRLYGSMKKAQVNGATYSTASQTTTPPVRAA